MYNSAVESLIKDSIKSAIYIDEKAWEPYTSKPETGDPEVEYSENIYKNFKDKGISVAVRAFDPKDLTDSRVCNYFFDNRDLVLLDWKLEGSTGEEHALNLLSNIVNRPNIHFCSIYTSMADLDNVFDNILSYFSGLSQNEYDDLELEVSAYETDLIEILPEIKRLAHNIFNKTIVKDVIGRLYRSHKQLLMDIKDAVKSTDTSCSLIKSMFALDKSLIKSPEAQPIPSLISIDQKLIVINNTIITILNKEETNSENILKDFSKHIINYKDSFVSMLGLEMQNILSRQSAFIDSNDIRITNNALIAHRKHIVGGIPDNDLSALLFDETIKNILIQNVDLKLKSESFSLLKKEVLDIIEGKSEDPTTKELLNLNVFYNSIYIKNKNRIDFGDVFKSGEDYYLCINALCDCLRPDKNHWQFFFVKGAKINSDKALILGDTSFVSYINEDLVVNWTNVESVDEPDMEKLDAFRYKPVYSKPLQFLIEKPDIIEGKIRLWKTVQKEESKPDVDYYDVEYLTTIKDNYTQRIANHAFTYPVRVGVDFVSKK